MNTHYDYLIVGSGLYGATSKHLILVWLSALYQQYKQLADHETNVIFDGRLAEYKYYDMAPIIEKVMELWKAENV